MTIDRRKLRAAEWLYRWNLSLGILGIVFTILTFMGVFTLILGPVLAGFGLSYAETAAILLSLVVAAVLGFGIFLDKVIQFWAAQATVATVRNPFLVDTLYQKELLSLLYVQAPMLRALRTLVGDRGSSLSHSAEVLSELDSALTKVATTIADRRWTVNPGERVYLAFRGSRRQTTPTRFEKNGLRRGYHGTPMPTSTSLYRVILVLAACGRFCGRKPRDG